MVQLYYAAAGSHENCVMELLKRPEVDVNTNLIQETTILHWSIQRGNLSAFKNLLNRSDVNINVRDRNGRTPLLWCLARRSCEMAMSLLSRDDIEADVVDNLRQGLMIMVAKWGRLDLIQAILPNVKSQLFAEDTLQLKAIDYAAQNGHWEAVETLPHEV